MNFADQGAGGVNIDHFTPFCFGGYGFGNAMCGKHDWRAFGNFVQIIDENGAFLFKSFDDEAVVDNFMAHIYWCAETFQALFDDLDGAFDASTKSARGGEQNF